jgi:hypothetical protein
MEKKPKHKPTNPTKTAVKKADRLAVRDASLMPFEVAKEQTENKPATHKKTALTKQQDFIKLIFEKNPVGRPRLYASAEALQAEITAYFVYCYEFGIKLTISGLILYCGFSDRKSFYEYEQKAEFTHIIKKARAIITLHYEGLLTEAFPQGAVFALKNLGWNAEEKTETTVKTATSFYIGGDAETIDYDEPE